MAGQTRYRIWDHFKRYPERVVDGVLDESVFGQLREEGVVSVPEFIGREAADRYGSAIDALAELELGPGEARTVTGNGYYVRDLLYKDALFHDLLSSPALSVARLLLGPRVQMRADARIAFERVPEAGLPWHLHFPGASKPVPPWYSPPHSLHCLVYLDDVGPEEGELLVVPRSYRTPWLTPEDIYPDAVTELAPRRGDCVMMHGNTWHRTRPSRLEAGRRRILFLGFTAAWVQGDSNAGGQPVRPVVETADPSASWKGNADELDELLGRFRW